VEIVIPEVRDPQSQEKIYQQLASIADIVLDGYVSQLESLRENASKQQHYNELQRRYEQDRQLLILPMCKYIQQIDNRAGPTTADSSYV
jgi:hypothetical protein